MDLLVSSAAPAVMKNSLRFPVGDAIFVPHAMPEGASNLGSGYVQMS